MKIRLLIALVFASAGCSAGNGDTGVPAVAHAPAALITITSKSPQAVERYRKGEELFFNARIPEAAAEFSEALTLDPGFALAHMMHGQSIPGPEGLMEVESAAAASASLPEPERLLIAGALADRRGETVKGRETAVRLTQVAPGDWRSHNMLGLFLFGERKFADAVQALRKATELNRQAGSAHNALGYAALRQGDTSGAIAAFAEYARVMPQEPNAQDSLGEAFMAAGRFDEAEAAFRKAEQLSPQFWSAEQGIAYARFFAGDVAGARAALVKARAIAPRPVDRVDLDDVLAVVAAAQGNMAEALRVLAASEQTADALPSVAFVSLRRAMVLVDMKRYRESLPLIAAATERADGGQLPENVSRELRGQALRARVAAEAGLADAASAQRTAAALTEAAKARADDLNAQSSMQYGQGMLAMVNGDFAAARAHFEQCLKDDHYCRLQIVTAADKAGDKAGAEAARAELLKLFVRDPVHVLVRSRLTRPAR